MSREDIKKQIENKMKEIDAQIDKMKEKGNFINKSIKLLEEYKGTLQKGYKEYYEGAF